VSILGVPMTDAEAIRRSLRHPVVFECVFERHFAALFGYLRRRVGPEVAEDLVAETFARAFAARRTYDLARRDARPWLFGIATNVLKAYWQHDLSVASLPATELGSDEAPASDGRVDAAAAIAERGDALRALPAEQREVLLLVAVAELSYEETAQALGIAVGTVRSRLSRARAQLLATVPIEEATP
jgi:RNA polymerase sigma-70 factor (ECF subfamily)